MDPKSVLRPLRLVPVLARANGSFFYALEVAKMGQAAPLVNGSLLASRRGSFLDSVEAASQLRLVSDDRLALAFGDKAHVGI